MCWSGEASMVMAVAGFSAAAYTALKKDPEPVALWACLLYFALMELLQAVSYRVVGQCDSGLNQLLTLLGYLHITFQPFFINAVALHFLPAQAARKVAPWVYLACFIGAIGMLVQLYPFGWAGHCTTGRPLCGDILCTVSGEWHIAWLLPLNGIGNGMTSSTYLGYGFLSYALNAFYLPALVGSWRFILFTYVAGPLLASATTGNINEWPAIWCLFSIGLLLVVMITPLRRYLHVGNPWWMQLDAWRMKRRNRVSGGKLAK